MSILLAFMLKELSRHASRDICRNQLEFSDYYLVYYMPIICRLSNKVKGSYHMEKEGLNRCINFLKGSKLEVDVLVTDRHKQINK